MSEKTCKNTSCNSRYTPTGIDDGFCSYECWETVNCKVPENKKDVFDFYSIMPEISAHPSNRVAAV